VHRRVTRAGGRDALASQGAQNSRSDSGDGFHQARHGAIINTMSRPAHPRFVRTTHWLATIATIALIISGSELVISHPRFYWGEVGNVNTTPVFAIPIPSSRATVPTGYSFTLPDQNGWSRSLHFQSAWLVLFVGAAYLFAGARSGHVRQKLVPAPPDRSWRALRESIAMHAHPQSEPQHAPGVYNVLQRTTYLGVLFVLFPLVIWTGLAMSPGFTAVVPWSVTLLGGHQSARTLHFVSMIGLLLFTIVHVLMISRAGFRRLVRAMIAGTPETTT
jgi:thiosulfate reductase cytochrome b subunit